MAGAAAPRQEPSPPPTRIWASISPPKSCAKNSPTPPRTRRSGRRRRGIRIHPVHRRPHRGPPGRNRPDAQGRAGPGGRRRLQAPPGRPRRWLTMSIAAAIVALLAVGLWLGYAWTQTRYYIGEHDQQVAIFNGVSQRLGPIQLSTLEAVTDIRMSDLPEFSQQRVRQTVPARDLYDAQRIVKNLELHRHNGAGGRVPDRLPHSHGQRRRQAPRARRPAQRQASATATASPSAKAGQPDADHEATPGATASSERQSLRRPPPRQRPARWPNDTHRSRSPAATERRAGPAGPGPRSRNRRAGARGR